jgi:hypothetical protein
MKDERHMNTIQSEQLSSSEFFDTQELSQRQQRVNEMVVKLRELSKNLRGRSGILDQAASIILESAQLHAEEAQFQETLLPKLIDYPLPVPDDISTIEQRQHSDQI